MSLSQLVINNPYNGEKIGEVEAGGSAEIDAAVACAHTGAELMARMPAFERSNILAQTAGRLRAEATEIGYLIASESGKTWKEGIAEAKRASGIFQLAAEEARRMHGETLPFDAFETGVDRTGYWIREPVGIVGAITPWNVPLALAAHKIAPAIAAGNAVVHKPAEQTPLDALKLQEIMLHAGLPMTALQVVTGLGEEAGDALVRHLDVPFVTFTGSRAVGMQLPARAGYKRVALELGGNSPVIITESANIKAASSAIAAGGYAVAGQLCISVQRVLVQRKMMKQLVDALVPLVEALVTGDPLDANTNVGCLIDVSACDRIESLVHSTMRSGAALLHGGFRVGRTSFAPTLITDIPADRGLAIDEAFGPIVALLPYDTLEQAVAIANATPYGLNAGIFTGQICQAEYAARNLNFGAVMINDVPSFRSDLMPYGGRKQSGIGREGVRFAIEEMTELKVICSKSISMN